jgi:hypothetical protein
MPQSTLPAGEEPIRSDDRPPEVTIFGAGIAGLTAAHELIERGFNVKVVEAAESPLEEYACQIGGMAANQLGRVKADTIDIKRLLARGIIPGQVVPKSDQDTASFAAIQKFTETGGFTIPFLFDSDEDKAILQRARDLLMQPVQRRFAVTHRIRFKKRLEQGENWLDIQDEYARSNRDKIAEVYLILRRAYIEYRKDWKVIEKRLQLEETSPGVDLDILQAFILGFTDADGLPEDNRRKSLEWAGLVRDELVRLNRSRLKPDQIPNLEDRLSLSGRGAEEPLGSQIVEGNRERSNRVELRIVGQRIPGEHGYRFFPGFYRHIFDTMRRTPVFDKRGDLTPETAFSQLVPTPDPSIGFARGEGLIPLKLTRFTSLRDIAKTLRTFKERAKFTDKDLLRLNTCFLKYLTSCKERRAKEAEEVSFWQYIGGERVKYSRAAEDFLEATPQALVAMSARETDARSQYDVVIQLLLQNPLEPFSPDMTLNGSTSEAWLGHWKNYLKRKGVRFYTGRLTRLKFNAAGDELIPEVSAPLGATWYAKGPIPEDKTRESDPKETDFSCDQSDFFVMAIPFEAASRQVWEAYRVAEQANKPKEFGGSFSPFRQLMQFDVVAGRRSQAGAALGKDRDPHTGRPTNKRDPLRDISGIQYFMPNNYRFSDGHVYYPDAPWALSSISQLAFWRERIEAVGKYIGQNSFDIGNWYKPRFTKDTGLGLTAWNSTRQELADKTYDQALEAINKDRAGVIVRPQYYHLDQGIKFVDERRDDDHVETKAAFRANALVDIINVALGASYKLELTGPDGKRAAADYKIETEFGDGDREKIEVRDALVEKINRSPEKAALAISVEVVPLAPARLVVSPVITTGRAVIRITGQSDQPYKLYLDGHVFSARAKPDDPPARQLVRQIRERQPYQVGMPDDSTITIHSKTTPDRRAPGTVSVAVANADNRIELLGSPRCTLRLHAPLPGSAVEQAAPLAEIPAEALEHALVLENGNPYIINVPGQWRYRPGLLDGIIWYASENDSLMRRWIPAGTFMATHTRLTTMEAANESGRHAVNAILHKILVPPKKGEPPLFNRQGKLIGDFCKIWDPEQYELPDLDLLKELDEALLHKGLPHLLDILKVIDVLEALPEDARLTDAARQIGRLLERQLALAAAVPLIGLTALGQVLRVFRDALRDVLSSDFRGAI